MVLGKNLSLSIFLFLLLLFSCQRLNKFLRKSHPSPSSKDAFIFHKTPQTYTIPVHWSDEICELAITETRLVPPGVCLPTLERIEKKKYQNITDWIQQKQLIVSEMLITGTPRSGTTMVSLLFARLKLPISNDNRPPTRIGTTSWAFAGPPDSYPLVCNRHLGLEGADQGPWVSRELYRFRTIFHQVRDPLSAIPSLTTVIPHWITCKSQILQITPDMNYNASIPHMALQIWVEWNRRLDRIPFIPVYRVEDLNLLDMFESINVSIPLSHRDYYCAYEQVRGYNTRVNQTDATKLTWNHIFGISERLGMIALNMAYRYGYRYYRNSTLVRAPARFIPSQPCAVKKLRKTWSSESASIKPIPYPTISFQQMKQILQHPIFIAN